MSLTNPGKFETHTQIGAIRMLSSRYKADGHIEAGIDEAGRGCFWGPMIAAAVVWPDEETWSDEVRAISAQIKDSKKVTPKRRAILFEAIKRYAIAWGIGRVEAAEIDSLGMTESNRLAFTRAIDGLAVKPERLLIDGLIHLDTTLEQIVEPKADGMYIAVAAASILAKETRDGLVVAACEADSSLHERYGIRSSKGYGTAAHSAGIKKYGLDSQHRRLFLRNLLGAEVYTEQPVKKVIAPLCLIQD